jgi:hypothetical protein
MSKELEELLKEAKRYLPILESVEKETDCWDSLTQGTGIATVNGLRHAIAKAEAAATPATGQGMKWVKASERLPTDEGRYVVKRLGEPMIVNARMFKDNIMRFTIPNGMQWKGWKDFEWLDQSPQPDKEPESQREEFKKGDRVTNGERNGVVWKVSDIGVHVRYDDGLFQVFHFNPYHHSQTSISKLSPTSAKSDKEIEELAERIFPFKHYVKGDVNYQTIIAAMLEIYKAKP